MSERNFFAELKRRNVYKVAVAYAVVAWLLIQAASIILPTFEAPGWTMKILVAALAIGFPIAVVLAWAFEVTPEGIKRAEDVLPNESITHRTGGKLIATTIALAVIAGALLVYQMVGTARWAVRSDDKDDGRRSATSLPVAEKSIAVLPFENLSEDKANAFFASGIQDEILTRLAKINSLKVISRTSTQQYQSKPASLSEIGRQLGVAHILEGSVQKVGNAVHINVQLIKAVTDTHVWAESYNRKLDDIFAVEAEVAGAVAEQLNAKLTGSEKQELAPKPTDNPAAYEAYLRGVTRFEELTQESRNAAVSAFDEAVRLDPTFALAWATLSRTHSITYLQNLDRSPARKAAAERSLAEAVRLQPQLAETQLARAWYQYGILRDYNGAREILQQLRVIWPSNATVVELLGYISARMGEYEKSTGYLDESIGLNPRYAFVRNQTARTRIARREFPAALRVVNEALQIWPDDWALESVKAQIFQGRGDLTQAQPSVDRLTTRLNENDLSVGTIAYQAKLRRTAPPPAALQYGESKAGMPGIGISNLRILQFWADLLELSGDKSQLPAVLIKLRDSTEAFLKEQPDNADLFRFQAYALAGLGERDAALSATDRGLALSANDARFHGRTEELKARLFARFGDKENAITLLQHLSQISYDGFYGVPLTPALLRLDPDFDPLRGDARFEKLCQDKPQ